MLRSMVMASSAHSAVKSLIVQRWMLGVSYQGVSLRWALGMRPVDNSRQRRRQKPKLWNETIERRPTRVISVRTCLGLWVACRVWLRIT